MKKSRFLKKDFFVDPDIRKAEGLPSAAFTDPEFLALEIARVFRRSWLTLPPSVYADVVGRRGAQKPFSWLEQPLFLQYDEEARLRAYPNVCTHAGYPLVHEEGVVERIVCGQHGRVFGFDGSVRDPKFRDSALFPRPCDRLRPLPLVARDRLLFLALEKPKASFEEVFAPMYESLGVLSVERMRRIARTPDYEVREVEGNWKQHAWNFTDSLHIPLIHHAPQGLADAAILGTYTTECHEHSLLQWVYAANPDAGFAPELIHPRFRDPKDPSRRVLALWWFVFPNMTFNFYPWGLSLNIYMPFEGCPEKTLFHWYHWVSDERLYAMRETYWHMSKVDREDTDAINAAARGIRSMFHVRGLFAAKREVGPHWFHRRLYSAVFE